MSEASVVPTSHPPPPPSRPPVSFPTARGPSTRRPQNAHDSTQTHAHAHAQSASPSSSSGSRRLSGVNQWNISLSALTSQSVSRAHYSPQEETHIRAQTAHFISLIGQQCKITQWAIATASVYMHVFYSRFSLRQYDRFEIAATCLFLAGKVEERRTRVDQVINAYFTIRLAAKNQRDQLKLTTTWFRDANGRPLKHPRVPAPDSEEFDAMRQIVYAHEYRVLDAVEFQFEPVHPYTNLMTFLRDRIYGPNYANESEEFLRREMSEKGGLAQVAWLFINDSLRSTLCLRYPPDVITVGIIALTIAHKKCAPPVRHNRAGESAPPWHEELFNVDKATLDEIGMVTLDALEPAFCFEIHPIPQQNTAAVSSSTTAASSTATSSTAAAPKPRAPSTSTLSAAPQQHVSSQNKSAAPSVSSRPPPAHHVPPTLPPGHNPHRPTPNVSRSVPPSTQQSVRRANPPSHRHHHDRRNNHRTEHDATRAPLPSRIEPRPRSPTTPPSPFISATRQPSPLSPLPSPFLRPEQMRLSSDQQRTVTDLSSLTLRASRKRGHSPDAIGRSVRSRSRSHERPNVESAVVDMEEDSFITRINKERDELRGESAVSIRRDNGEREDGELEDGELDETNDRHNGDEQPSDAHQNKRIRFDDYDGNDGDEARAGLNSNGDDDVLNDSPVHHADDLSGFDGENDGDDVHLKRGQVVYPTSPSADDAAAHEKVNGEHVHASPLADELQRAHELNKKRTDNDATDTADIIVDTETTVITATAMMLTTTASPNIVMTHSPEIT